MLKLNSRYRRGDFISYWEL